MQVTFKAGLKAIGATCLALHPWEDSASLKSSWCHFQLWCALGVEVPVAVETTASEDERLRQALTEDMERPMKQLDTRLEWFRKSAEAPTPEERSMLDKAIDKTEGGHEELGRKLSDVLHKWLLEQAKKVLDALPADERETSTLVDRTAKLLQDFGDLEAAEPLCREQVESRSKALGEHHADTLYLLSASKSVPSSGWPTGWLARSLARSLARWLAGSLANAGSFTHSLG